MPDYNADVTNSQKARAAYVCNGASNHSTTERQSEDYYATDPDALRKLLDVYDGFSKNIWEVACGGNHLSNVLKERGHNVRCTDIIDRVHDGSIEVMDFLKSNEQFDGDIITNPPYTYATEFVNKALETVTDGHKVAMFLKLTFLESSKRKVLFESTPPALLYVSTKRIQCAMNGQFDKYAASGTAVAYGWYIWVKGVKTEPVIRWFNK